MTENSHNPPRPSLVLEDRFGAVLVFLGKKLGGAVQVETRTRQGKARQNMHNNTNNCVFVSSPTASRIEKQTEAVFVLLCDRSWHQN